MQSLRQLYLVGSGPSASHTLGPKKAAETYRLRHPGQSHYKVILYGSLAATGRGHRTDKALQAAFAGASLEISWEPGVELPLHPNGMEFFCGMGADGVGHPWRVYSVGGGALAEEGRPPEQPDIYQHHNLSGIMDYCREKKMNFADYVLAVEGAGFVDFLAGLWRVMQDCISRGLAAEGLLHGGLHVQRKARSFHQQALSGVDEGLRRTAFVSAYALAVSEENASSGEVVTAPTCGACGVLPGVLAYFSKQKGVPDAEILRAMATAGLIGNLAKRNASISGAEVGCQGEVGVACAMAAAAACQIGGGSLKQIEYAAEMAIEHHLGLTCDPVGGMVQIPCIERNAVAGSRALECANYALLSDGEHKISFDEAIQTMKETGHDLLKGYRETAGSGLAATVAKRNHCG